MEDKKFIEILNEVLKQKGLTLKSSLKELSKTYPIDDELDRELENRISNSPDIFDAHWLYYEELKSYLNIYDEPNTSVLLKDGSFTTHADLIQMNIRAGKKIEIKNYVKYLYLNEELEEGLIIGQIESNLENLARFYCIVTFLPKLSKKMRSYYRNDESEVKAIPMSNNLPFKTVGLNLMFLKELGMLDKLLKEKPINYARLLADLFPAFKGQTETIVRILTAIKSENTKDKNHPYFTPGNEEKVKEKVKEYFT